MRKFSIFCLLSMLIFNIQCSSKSNDASSSDVRAPGSDEQNAVLVQDKTQESGQSAFLRADKMNALYVGIDNPITLETIGLPPNDLKLEITKGKAHISPNGAGTYLVMVPQPGEISFTATSTDGSFSKTFAFRALRMPDPFAHLGNALGGEIGAEAFKAQNGLSATLPLAYFDLDARCSIAGFNLGYIAKGKAPVEVTNKGGVYDAQAQQLVNQANTGDMYYFENVRAQCPGDMKPRSINSLVFKIK